MNSGHRYHNLDEIEISNERATPSLLNGKRVSTPAQAGTGSHKHHAHHHGSHHTAVHHHHHHHQENKPPRIPTTTIKNDAVLESIRHLPRQHLGLVVYSSTLEPATATTSSNAKFGYLSTPIPMPRYDGQENCTYTVQIPRIYLEPQEREEICRRRALWGTDIYTDDSDVLAATMHSGWVRSEFGEDIDHSMLEVKNHPQADSKIGKTTPPPEEMYTSPPDEPMVPPPGKDLHVTLHVLPTLEKYASHVAHGIKSRAWGNTHDGVSFRIEKLEWVDTKESNSDERSGEARRKRMKTRFCPMGQMIGPIVRLDTSTLGAERGVDMSAVAVAVEA